MSEVLDPTKVSVTEKIKFDSANEIERHMPELLVDNGKMSSMIWNNFCDKVDDEIKPLKYMGYLNAFLWFLAFVIFILNATGWYIFNPSGVDGETAASQARIYGIIVPVLFVLLYLACSLEGFIAKKVGSKISKHCANASNHDRDLKLTLNTEDGDKPKYWFIEVALRNTIDLEYANANYVTASAVEAEVAEAVAEATPAKGPPPKKYVKDAETGMMSLNPAYKVWKNSQ